MSGRDFLHLSFGSGAARKFLLRNDHLGSDADGIEKVDHILGLHSHATVARGLADAVFLRRSVNVNEPIEGIAIGGFKSAQPQDAADNGVTAWSIGLQDLTVPLTTFDDSASRKTMPNFRNNLCSTQRCAIAARLVSETKFGCRNFELLGQLPTLIESEFLFLHAHDHLCRPPWSGAVGKERRHKWSDEKPEVLNATCDPLRKRVRGVHDSKI